jgi:hypothetical protein
MLNAVKHLDLGLERLWKNEILRLWAQDDTSSLRGTRPATVRSERSAEHA